MMVVRQRPAGAEAARLAGALSLLLWSHAASGAPATVDSEAEAAKEDFRIGTELAEAGRREEALAKLEASYAAMPSWQALYQIAVVLRQLGRHVESRDTFGKLAAQHGDELSPELKRKVASLSADEGRRIAVLELIGLEGCVVTIRGRQVVDDGSQPRRIELDPGAHEIVAECPGEPPLRKQIRPLAAGEQRSLEFWPRRGADVDTATGASAGPPAPVAADRSVPSAAHASPDGGDDGSGLAPWVVAGVGGAVAVAGGIMIGVAVSDKSAVENAPVASRWSDVESAYDRAPIFSGAGIALLCTGIAAAAAGVTWGLLSDDGGEPQATLNAVVTPRGLIGYGSF